MLYILMENDGEGCYCPSKKIDRSHTLRTMPQCKRRVQEYEKVKMSWTGSPIGQGTVTYRVYAVPTVVLYNNNRESFALREEWKLAGFKRTWWENKSLPREVK